MGMTTHIARGVETRKIYLRKKVFARVEFSKPKLEISITITKALKLLSFGASYGHMGAHFEGL